MRRLRGVTLLELLIALVVTAFAMSGALLMIQAQQRLFYTGSKTRQSQQNGRAALLYLEQKVPLAGFGTDPANALDFGWYGCAGGCVRDAVDGPDELVFYARNPAARVIDGPPLQLLGKVWNTERITSSTLTLTAHGGENFMKGQIVQLVCRNQFWFTHVTLAATHRNVPAGSVDLELEPTAGTLSPNVAANPFTRQDAADQTLATFSKWNACAASTPRAFLVDRYRFYVRPVNMGGGRWDPYLVLDQGVDADLDDDVDADDEILVAEGIENFQVSYVFLDPTLPPVGATRGTAISLPPFGSPADRTPETISRTDFPGNFDPTKRYPLFESSLFFTASSTPLQPKRVTNDQGNIRAIRIALVARSPEPDPSSVSNLAYAPGSPLWVMNFDRLPPWIGDYLAAHHNEDRYMRSVLTTTIALPNLPTRGLSPQ
jgi:type IV pilus assembly protein PilW